MGEALSVVVIVVLVFVATVEKFKLARGAEKRVEGWTRLKSHQRQSLMHGMSALPKRFASRVAGIYGFVRRLVSTSTTPAVTKTRSFVHLALDGLIIANVVNVATKRAPIKFKLLFFCFSSFSRNDYLDTVIVPEDFVSKDERLERVRRSDFRSYFARFVSNYRSIG
ncbi:hypothetical protein V1478_004028 [Vespula squamosa]|uniref:Uncharacterized protein n=1 Tax=Vespula squamosa TaxID=30214 RepID=A0ABD2BNH4_VESSQ